MTYEQLKNEVRISAFKKAGIGVLSFAIGIASVLYAYSHGDASGPNLTALLLGVAFVIYFKWCMIVALFRFFFPGMRANKLLRRQNIASVNNTTLTSI